MNIGINNLKTIAGKQFLNKKFETDKIFEYLYLGILALFWIYFFGQTIMYPEGWPQINYSVIRALLIVYVVFKYAYNKDAIFDIKESILALLLLVSFILVSLSAGYSELFDIAFLIIGAKNISYINILKLYIALKVPLIITTIIGSQLGIIENLIYNQDGRVRESYGFIYPTDFAAQVFFAVAAWVLIRQIKMSYAELAGMLIIAAFLMIHCDARCSVTSILLTVIGVVSQKAFRNQRIAKYRKRFSLKNAYVIAVIIPYICASLMIFLCRFYDQNNTFMAFINSVTSQRLKFGKRTFDSYNVPLFGQYIEMAGNGGSIQKPAKYTFIDCSYINILMRFGFVVFIAVMLLLNFVALKYCQNMFVLGILTLICIHSIMEHHLLDIHYNFILLLPFCLVEQKENTAKIPMTG